MVPETERDLERYTDIGLAVVDAMETLPAGTNVTLILGLADWSVRVYAGDNDFDFPAEGGLVEHIYEAVRQAKQRSAGEGNSDRRDVPTEAGNQEGVAGGLAQSEEENAGGAPGSTARMVGARVQPVIRGLLARE